MRYLFVGPSLPDVHDIVDGRRVRVLPPVAAGDLLDLAPSEGDVVGIVDGYFHQRMAVRHKEIFALLAAGVRVLGASSIGALRAVELERYGMECVGAVCADYRAGRVVGDDEVALLHGPADAGYPAFSQPLVNIRATLAAAVRGAVIEDGERDALVAALSAMPYQRRGYDVLVSLAGELGIQSDRRAALAAFCREHAVDVKRSDALLLLDRLDRASGPATSRPELSRTRLLHNWQLAARTHPARDGGSRVSRVALVRVCQLFAVDFAAFYRGLVLAMIAEECSRACGGDRSNRPLPVAAAEHGRHRGFYPDRLDVRDIGFLARWTTEAERRGCAPEELLSAFLVRSFRVTPTVTPRAAVFRSLSTSALGEAERIVRAAGQVESAVRANNPDYDDAKLADDQLTRWFAARWQTEPDDVELAAMDRGLGSIETFLRAARPYYLLAKYNPGAVDFTVGSTAR